MKIALVIYGSLEVISGGYLYDRKLIEYLKRSGDQVEIISLPWRSYSVHLLDNLSRRLLNRLVDLHVDILLQDELNHPSLFAINPRLSRMRRYPVISIVHHLRVSEVNPWYARKAYAAIEHRYLQSVDGFIFNSQTTKGEVEKLLGYPWSGATPGVSCKSIIAYPAGDQFNPQVDDRAIVDRARQSGPLRLVYLGNLIPRKGLDILLKAVLLISDVDWRLTVVGNQDVDRRFTKAVHDMVADTRIKSKISFEGVLPAVKLAALLRQSHVLAMPSSYEGYGIAYLEGMGFGLPAIATDKGAAWEVVTDGVNGFLVTAGKPNRLAERIVFLASDRAKLAEMSLAARQRYLRQPTWEETGDVIRSFLAKLVVQYS